MDYAVLQNDLLPTALQNKPRWMTCMVCAVGLLIVTLSAVSVGAIIGYTYCYLEHRRGFRAGDTAYATNLKVVNFSSQYDENDKKTINSVLFSSVLVSRLVDIGHTLKNDISHLQLEKNSSCRKKSQPNIPQFL